MVLYKCVALQNQILLNTVFLYVTDHQFVNLKLITLLCKSTCMFPQEVLTVLTKHGVEIVKG